MSVTYRWIAKQAEFELLCQRWMQKQAIALDTEFIRSHTYYANLGLIQIADDQGIYLLDPQALHDMQALADVFAAAGVTKVIHASSEDLDVLFHTLGVCPEPLFDTQIAAAFAGFGFSIGYANLLNVLLGKEIPKQETRSDWLQRPLSEAQKRYAALDVAYLLPLSEQLGQILADKGQLAWVEQECQGVIEKVRHACPQKHYYLRIKSAWKLKEAQLAVLKALCAWREDQAMVKNVPRRRIVKDNSLFELAWHLPLESRHLKGISGLACEDIAQYGEYLLQKIRTVLDDCTDYPERLPAPLSKEQVQKLRQLKQYVASLGEGLQLPAELLVRKKDYESLLRAPKRVPQGLQGWREQTVAEPLMAYLHILNASADSGS